MTRNFVWIVAVLVFVVNARRGVGQQNGPPGEPAKIADLVSEAKRNNPQIQAAKREWESTQQLPTQVSTLPDPQVVLQQLNVGSPRPFAGFSNSDFAYIGLGASQDFPYPGKLRLRGELAKKDAEVAKQKAEAVRLAILSQLKNDYFRIAFLARQSSLLGSDSDLLEQMEKAAEIKYRSGGGNQQEVLQAQLERTKLLRENTANQLEAGKIQAELKQLLGRSQASPDLITENIAESQVQHTFEELLAAAQANNPQISGAQKMVEKQDVAIQVAKRDFYPDFNAQFMWQRTDPTQYRAYYMFTVGARIPLYRKRKLQPELAQAQIDKSRAQSELEMQSQEVSAMLRQEFVAAEKSSELLKIYREGLLPQAKAELQAGFAAYESNRQDFQALLASFMDVLKLEEEYWKTLSEHEAALGQMEEITGVTLR
jgi:cobalt-zinc-cadmium efflux system outer membrane protein